MTNRNFSDPAREEAYKLGVEVTKERALKLIHRLRSDAITSERKDAFDKAIQAVEELAP